MIIWTHCLKRQRKRRRKEKIILLSENHAAADASCWFGKGYRIDTFISQYNRHRIEVDISLIMTKKKEWNDDIWELLSNHQPSTRWHVNPCDFLYSESCKIHCIWYNYETLDNSFYKKSCQIGSKTSYPKVGWSYNPMTSIQKIVDCQWRVW